MARCCCCSPRCKQGRRRVISFFYVFGKLIFAAKNWPAHKSEKWIVGKSCVGFFCLVTHSAPQIDTPPAKCFFAPPNLTQSKQIEISFLGVILFLII
jgi:hypothetical protein